MSRDTCACAHLRMCVRASAHVRARTCARAASLLGLAGREAGAVRQQREDFPGLLVQRLSQEVPGPVPRPQWGESGGEGVAVATADVRGAGKGGSRGWGELGGARRPLSAAPAAARVTS